MKMKLVLVKEFRNLVESNGIHQVVANKTKDNCWQCFGVNQEQQVCYFIKAARGSNEVREWAGINYLCNFIEKLGVNKFTVQGLSGAVKE